MPRKPKTKTAKDASALSPKEAKAVKKIIQSQAELKYFTFFQAPTGISNAGSLVGTPFDVPNGTTDQERVGDSITLTGLLDFRYSMVALDTSNVVRVIIFQWRAQSYASPLAPTVTDILFTSNYLSHYNHDQRKNYNILYDKMHQLNGNGSSASYPLTNNGIITVHKRVSLKRAAKKIHYIGGGLQGQNRLFILFISDSSALSHPSVSYVTHFTYYDS